MVSKLHDARVWLNRVIDIKIKYVLITGACIIGIVIAFQHQTSALADTRIQDVENTQRTTCLTRVDTREDVRSMLLFIVDLSDVFDSEKARAYTASRISFIDAKYPPLDPEDC